MDLTKERIVVLGGSGKVGRQLIKRLAWEKARFIAPTRRELDLSLGVGIGEYLTFMATDALEGKPTVIINAAAFNGLEACMDNPQWAYTINTAVPATVATAAQALGALYVGYGTDYIYENAAAHEAPIAENCHSRVNSIYSSSKAFGLSLSAACAKHLILNVSSIYDDTFTGPLNPVIQAATGAKSIRIFKQNFTPTSARLIAEATLHAIKQDSYLGLFNFVIDEIISRENFAKLIIERFFGIDSPETKIPFETFEPAVPRPQHCHLDNSKFKKLFKYRIPPIIHDLTETFPCPQESLDAYRRSKVVQNG